MWKNFCILFLLALVGSKASAFDEAAVEMKLQKGLENYLQTGQMSSELEEAIKSFQLPHFFRKDNQKGIVSNVICGACRVVMNIVINASRYGATTEQLSGLVTNLCIWLNVESKEVCRGTIAANAYTLTYIVNNRPFLTSDRICSVLLQDHCVDPKKEDWTIDIPPKSNVQVPPKESKGEIFKVLQVSDIHYDPEYEVGSNGACDEPLCCLAGSVPTAPEGAAGQWGDYRRCDTPMHVIEDSFDHMVAQHKDLSYIYFTGDIINHKVWDTDIDRNILAIKEIFEEFKRKFGETPVYPILGNHEPHPVNLFASDSITDPHLATKWVFELAAEEWKAWLPEATKETILKGGYYTVLVKPGFRIVALNSNVCYTFNWWLLYDEVDPFGQLKWLVETLQKAEQAGEKVHILSHIPTNDNKCLRNWSNQYVRIINRFAHIIAAQFNGHTHDDQTIIYFDTEDFGNAINVAFNGGSLTTYADVNPNYKIYDVDSSSLEVVDYESWSYNITEANLSPEQTPNWFKLYSFKSAYQVNTLHPQELQELTERMAKDPALTELYFRFKHRDSDTLLREGCDVECELENLCYMVTFVSDHDFHCNVLTDMYNSARPELVNKAKAKLIS